MASLDTVTYQEQAEGLKNKPYADQRQFLEQVADYLIATPARNLDETVLETIGNLLLHLKNRAYNESWNQGLRRELLGCYEIMEHMLIAIARTPPELAKEYQKSYAGDADQLGRKLQMIVVMYESA